MKNSWIMDYCEKSIKVMNRNNDKDVQYELLLMSSAIEQTRL